MPPKALCPKSHPSQVMANAGCPWQVFGLVSWLSAVSFFRVTSAEASLLLGLVGPEAGRLSSGHSLFAVSRVVEGVWECCGFSSTRVLALFMRVPPSS